MKFLIVSLFILSGCGMEVHGHVDPVQVEVQTAINYAQAKSYCSAQCAGDTVCTNNCYDQFLAVLAAASAQSVTQ